ncbi:MAG: cytochrome c [Pseudomonadota bacterium]
MGFRGGWLAVVLTGATVAIAGCGTNQIEGLTTPPSNGSFDAGAGGNGGFQVACDQAEGLDGGAVRVPGKVMSITMPTFDGIVAAAEPPPPISGGTLIMLRDGVTAVAADADRDRVYIVDVTNRALPTLRASIALSLRDEPGRLVQDGSGLVHVVLRRAGALATIDPVKSLITMRRQVCAVPRGIAYDTAQDRLHVACAGGELVTFAPTGASPVRTLKMQQDLRDVVVDGSNLIISRFRSAEMMVIDGNGTMLERSKPPVYANPGVRSGAQFEPSVAWRTVAMPNGGGAVMVHQRGMRGTVGRTLGGYGGFSPCDTIVHTSVTKMKSGDRPVPGPAMPGFVLPVDLALSPDGKMLAMVAAGNGHVGTFGRKLFITNVDDATAEWDGGCGMDDKHGPAQTPVCSVASFLPSPDGTCPVPFQLCGNACIDPSVPCPGQFPGGGTGGTGGTAGSTGVGGSTGAGASTGAAPTMNPAVDGGSTDASGTTPEPARSPPLASDGGSFQKPTCGVDLPANQEPVAVAFAGMSDILVQTREPARLWIVSNAGGASTSVSLSQEGRADTGHAIFHSNSGGGLACASCHPEGHEDGRVWNFECEGDRRTQDLGGGIMGTEPFHWSGDLATFPKLVDTVFVGRMSGPELTAEQAATTLRWINTIPSRPALRPPGDLQVQRGKALFESATVACSSCHTGAQFTNNKTVAVGTAAAFQVPSLRGLAWRSPFMHDGCAPTVASRFGNKLCDGGDAHGKTSQLTSDEINDLVAYLESL